jgi:uncharacterized membrane-anchored protein YhcB (DUF1043 family)
MTEEVITTIVSAIAGSSIVSIIIGVIIKRLAERKMDKIIASKEEYDKYKLDKEAEQRRTEIKTIIDDSIKPLVEKVEKIEELSSQIKDGTVTLLREEMKQTKDQFERQGYVSTSDYASWHELYNTYKSLGGNHFKEYVDTWKQDVENLHKEDNIKNKKI